MADTKSTGHIEPPVLSPETLAAVELLLAVVRDRIPHRPKTATQAAVDAVIDGFDRVGLAGRPRRMCVVVDGVGDPTLDARFLGDKPEEDEEDGTCTFCGDPYFMHWDGDSGTYLPGAEWHRRDCHDRTGGEDGFYSDEIRAVAR